MSFLNTVLKSFLGDKNAKDLKEVKKVVAKIKAAEPNIQTLTDDGLREKTAEFKEKIAKISELAVGDACTGSNPRPIDPAAMEKLFNCTYYGTEVDF